MHSCSCFDLCLNPRQCNSTTTIHHAWVPSVSSVICCICFVFCVSGKNNLLFLLHLSYVFFFSYDFSQSVAYSVIKVNLLETNITGTFARRLAQEFPTWQVLLCEFVLGSHHFWYYFLFYGLQG
jgi:hypothetical protein